MVLLTMYKIYIFMQKKLIRILARALHEYVNFVHDPEKQYRSLSAFWNTGVDTRTEKKIGMKVNSLLLNLIV